MIKHMVFIPFHVQTATIEMEVKRLCLSPFVKKSWWDFIYNPYIALNISWAPFFQKINAINRRRVMTKIFFELFVSLKRAFYIILITSPLLEGKKNLRVKGLDCGGSINL